MPCKVFLRDQLRNTMRIFLLDSGGDIVGGLQYAL